MDLAVPFLPGGEPIGTIYFGGGTPSLCTVEELAGMIEKLHANFTVEPGVEITLEVNPDDITMERLREWRSAGINRLSIGIQSFFEEDLRWMNRAHTARQAIDNLEMVRNVFDNMSVDLIYGSPGLSDAKWKENVDRVVTLNIPHLSCYALTVEPKTPLQKMILQHRSEDVDPDVQSRQFLLLMDWLEKAGYEHYEISNFAKPGLRSRHNSSYWQSRPYIGLGPSAHSYDGNTRWWNVANNTNYIDSINKGIIPLEREQLTASQKINEYIMISLRTSQGLSLTRIGNILEENEIQDLEIMEGLKAKGEEYKRRGLMEAGGDYLRLTREGKLLADGIASDLFMDQ
jgi:oxygen-independent coproporphyrinogen III oxidase